VTFLFAELAAFCNALSVVTQHFASTSAPSGLGWWRLAWRVVRNPMWLIGAAALLGGFVFQALALHDGQLSIVQPLLVTELVFTLALRRIWFRQHLRPAAWASAALTCAALAVFIIAAEPQGGHPSPTASAWVWAGVTMGGLAAVFTILASWGSPTRRAALYGAAAAIVWALEATFIKSTVDILSASGVSAMVTTWPLYALIGAGIVGSLLVQAALHVGPISVSQPIMVSVDPFVSVILSVWLFGERFTANPARIVLAGLSFAVMTVGIVLMSRTAPLTLTEDVDPPVGLGATGAAGA